MNIIIFSKLLGSAMMTKAIAKEYYGLTELGNDVKIITLNEAIPDFYAKYYKKIAIDVLNRNGSSSLSGNEKMLPNVIVSEIRTFDIILSTVKVFKKFLIENPEMILFHEVTPAVYSIPYLFVTRKRYAIYLHDNSFMGISESKSKVASIKNIVAKKLLTSLIKRSSVTICVSSKLEKNIKEIVKTNNITHLLLGNDIAKEFPDINLRNNVLTYSFWDRWRKPEVYLDIASLLPNGMKLIIAGVWHDPEYLARFRQKIDEMKLTHKVTLYNGISEGDKNTLLSSALALVRFGYGEDGMSGGVLEAMGFGCPVIVNSGLGASSNLVDGENGFIAETPEAVAAIIVKLRQNSALLEKVSRTSYLNARNLDWKFHNAQLNRLLSESE